MKANFHTHSTWCDGRNTPEEMIAAALARGFTDLGFSSHISLPEDDACVITPGRETAYAEEIRALAEKYRGQIRIWLGVEADDIPGVTAPDRARYAHIRPDYVIGSIHYVIAPDGGRVSVDHTPQILADGIRAHFGGDAEAYVRAYFRQERRMVAACDFDVVGHPDLVRKFNVKAPYFDETAAWYRAELELTADAIAASGKIVEVNTGAISRGWLDDAYPSAAFRALLRERGVRFILSSDAHAAAAIDCAFDRFGEAEQYVGLFGSGSLPAADGAQ